jgi:hypothetical protein
MKGPLPSFTDAGPNEVSCPRGVLARPDILEKRFFLRRHEHAMKLKGIARFPRSGDFSV